LSSVDKALNVIIRLSEPPYELKLTDIADYLKMSKSAAYQILCDLEKRNFLFRTPTTKMYHLGPILLRLGYVYNEIKGLKNICQPFMREVAQRTGFTCYVSVREGIHSFLAYKEDSTRFKNVFYREIMGSLQSFNCGSTGKLLAAYLKDEEKEELMREGFEKRASQSIMDRDALIKEYARIRNRGYSTAVGEYNESTFGISVPITDRYQDVVAAIGIVGPLEMYSEDFCKRTVPVLKEQAQAISDILRFR